MSNKLDLHSQFEYKIGLAPVVGGGNTLLTGLTIDTQGYDGVEFVISTGTLADAAATWTPKLYEDTDSAMGTETEVTDTSHLYGVPAVFSQADDASVFSFGYRGAKRYLRVKIQPADNAGSDPISVLVVLRKKKVGSTL